MKRRLLQICWLAVLLPLFGGPNFAIGEAVESDLFGRTVTAVEIRNPSNLRTKGLLEEIGIRPGDTLTRDGLEKAEEALRVRGIFERIEVRLAPVAEGVRVTFELVPRQIIASIIFVGNHSLDRTELTRLLRIPPGSPLDATQIEEACERVRAGYKLAGHFSAEVKPEVDVRWGNPAQLELTVRIDEGHRSRIHEVTLDTALPEDVAHLERDFRKRAIGEVASRERVRELGRELLVALRKEGYLEAYVRPEPIQYEPLTGNARVGYRVEVRDPLSIAFVGNSLFSTEELLTLLRMETRTVPFSPNAIPNLTREIERFYQQRGYLFTTVSYTELDSIDGRQRFEIHINESRRFRLGEITFSGNDNVTAATLEELIVTRPAGPGFLSRWFPGFLIEEQLEADLETIQSYYHELGFADAEVSSRLSSDDDSSELQLLIVINEGERRRAEDVEVVWQNTVGRPEGDDLLSVRPQFEAGDPLETRYIEDARRLLQQQVAALGFPNARVEVEVDSDETVRFIVDPGIQVSLGRILNRGNYFTRDFVINQELEFASGNVWDPAKIEASEQQLYRLGLFRGVEIEPLDGVIDSSTEDVAVRVSERDTGSFEVGADVNSDDGLHLVGEVRQRNLSGNGNGLALGVDGYIKTRALDAGTIRLAYNDPRLGSSDLELLSELYAQTSIELAQDYSYDRYGSATLVRFPITEELRGNFTASLFRERLFDVPEDMVLGPHDRGSHFITMLGNELDYDIRDDTFNPRSGFRSVLRTSLATELLASDANFFGVSSQNTAYLPLTKRVVWVNNAVARAIVPFGDTDVVPLSQRIFLGGRGSLRGFSLNAVGPRGEDGNIVGGDTSLLFNTQLEISLTESLMATVFFDAGQTRLEHKGSFAGDPLSLSDLRYSPGVGFHYKTPIGPLGVEYGIALDREFGERFGRVNFSIGSPF